MTGPQLEHPLPALAAAWDKYEAHAGECERGCGRRREDGSPVAMCGTGAILWDTFTRLAAAFARAGFRVP